MGTRADFYIRNENKEPKMEWLGSIAWDGYEIDGKVERARTEDEFRSLLSEFFNDRTDVTLPENGWPWPWDDSRTTDFAHIFENGKVMGSCFGGKLFDPTIEREDTEDEESSVPHDYFPDMSAIKNVAMGPDKSGLIIIGGE
jgi:hypothetical protein